MADQNQTQLYQAQYDAIGSLFHSADGEADWRSLATQLGVALSDPYLPRWHRARYHIIYAWCAREPQLEIQKARETLDDMAQVMWGSSEEAIDEILKPLRNMLAITEETIEKDNAEL
jgi:hypothetical protein